MSTTGAARASFNFEITTMDPIALALFKFGALIFSVIVHEVAHGFMALRLGDETAKYAGRLTLNPIKHVDPVGTVLLPLILYLTNSPILFGWAKPVPFNPRALYKDFRYGPLKVALAGPGSNLALAAVFALIIRFAAPFLGPVAAGMMAFIVLINCILAVFNSLPIPPLDGSKIVSTFLLPQQAMAFERFGLFGMVFVVIALYLFSGVINFLSSSLFALLVGGEGVMYFLQVFSSR